MESTSTLENSLSDCKPGATTSASRSRTAATTRSAPTASFRRSPQIWRAAWENPKLTATPGTWGSSSAGMGWRGTGASAATHRKKDMSKSCASSLGETKRGTLNALTVRQCPFLGTKKLCEHLRAVRGVLLPLVRSEERRVGKECRSRWSPYH